MGLHDPFWTECSSDCIVDAKVRKRYEIYGTNSEALTDTIQGWRRGSKAVEERKLLALFADDPKAPFSIHRFVEHGASACGKHPGEWFGPSATARCIQ